MIEPAHPKLSLTRQCELLELPRSTYYHQPKAPDDQNLALMRVIDETYLAYAFFGSRQMTRWLLRQGYAVNRKRVRRLMRLMNLTDTAFGFRVLPEVIAALAVFGDIGNFDTQIANLEQAIVGIGGASGGGQLVSANFILCFDRVEGTLGCDFFEPQGRGGSISAA